MIRITKTVEWEMGHRIPNHAGKCRNPHGHHYKLELTVSGPLCGKREHQLEGMIVDFDRVRRSLQKQIFETLDHSFMVYNKDKIMSDFFCLNDQENFKIVYVPFIPTVENISRWCFDQLHDCFGDSVKIQNVRVYETPTSWADFVGQAV